MGINVEGNTPQSHVAKTGRDAGRFVPCPAKIQCRNKGTHIDASTVEAVKEKYGDATLENYVKLLEDRIASTIPSSKTAIPVITQWPFYNQGIAPLPLNQLAFNDFLQDNGIQPYLDRRVKFDDESDRSGIVDPDDESESRYYLRNINVYKKVLINAKPVKGSAAKVDEQVSETLENLINKHQTNPTYSMEDDEVETLTSVALTPNLSTGNQLKLTKVYDILEDYNMRSFRAYLRAVHNLNHNQEGK